MRQWQNSINSPPDSATRCVVVMVLNQTKDETKLNSSASPPSPSPPAVTANQVNTAHWKLLENGCFNNWIPTTKKWNKTAPNAFGEETKWICVSIWAIQVANKVGGINGKLFSQKKTKQNRNKKLDSDNRKEGKSLYGQHHPSAPTSQIAKSASSVVSNRH